MSTAEDHVRPYAAGPGRPSGRPGVAEDHALLRLTTARPAELASSIGPRLRPAHSAELVASDAAPDATSAGLRAAGVDLLGPFGRGVEPSVTAPEGALSSPRLAAVPEPARPTAPAVPLDARLWLEIGALIPEVARRRRQPGRRRRDDRAVLEGILHVLATGIGWRELPQDLGCGSGVTCWRRLREWIDGGTWAVLEPRLRAALGAGCGVDWDRPWAGTGRSTVAATPAPAGGVARTAHDPGATPVAIARRVAWAGPSLV